ncbi:MAG: hypothetical protein NPIRA05_03040 [Nitrospirales bacterium]|nr:MAG: hypothetical protein NPIRA05_03040 [Nitrospirales bacterium]
MSRQCWIMVVWVLSVSIAGCATSEFFTVTIYDSPQRVVRLQTKSLDDTEGGYSHPASVSVEQMTRVLTGLFTEVGDTPFSRSGTRHRAFSDSEIKFFAPLFVRGLEQATPEEVVTFFETAEISDQQEATTSGGVFVRENGLYIIMSNHGVKTAIWQDNDQYESPQRLSPLEPMAPEPGRLVFEPAEFMLPLEENTWLDTLKGKPWHAAVKYLELPEE